jgi:hypothetical protein
MSCFALKRGRPESFIKDSSSGFERDLRSVFDGIVVTTAFPGLHYYSISDFSGSGLQKYPFSRQDDSPLV